MFLSQKVDAARSTTRAAELTGLGVFGVLVLLQLSGCGAKSVQEIGRTTGDEPAIEMDAGADAGPPTTMSEDPPVLPVPPQEPPPLPQSTFEEPGCPEPAERLQRIACERDVEDACPAGQGCFPFVNYPANPCEPETFGTRCEPVGDAVQGQSCVRRNCADGFLCVSTGGGTQCAQICELPGPNTCAAGLICGSVDIEGFGVCF